MNSARDRTQDCRLEAIEKQRHCGLSAIAREEIELVAAAIENGTYVKKKYLSPVAPDPVLPVESILTELCAVQSLMPKLSDVFSLLSKISEESDKGKIRTALRLCIDQLEYLFDLI